MNRKFIILSSELVVASGESDQRFEMAFQAIMNFYINSIFDLEFNSDQTFCSPDLTTNSENRKPKFSRTFLDCDRYRLTNI